MRISDVMSDVCSSDLHLVAVLQAFGDDHLALVEHACRHRHDLCLALANHDQAAEPIGGALNGLLWNLKGFVVYALPHTDSHIHAWQQDLIGIGEFGAHAYLASARGNRTTRKTQPASMGVRQTR